MTHCYCIFLSVNSVDDISSHCMLIFVVVVMLQPYFVCGIVCRYYCNIYVIRTGLIYNYMTSTMHLDLVPLYIASCKGVHACAAHVQLEFICMLEHVVLCFFVPFCCLCVPSWL